MRRVLVATLVAFAIVGTSGAPAWADGSQNGQGGGGDGQSAAAQPQSDQGQGSDPAAAPSDRQAQDDEQQFLQLANQVRAQQGAPPITTDAGLTAIARWWANNMASSNDIFHNYQLPNYVSADVTTDWAKLGENVGKGPDVPKLHRAFVNSPHHYEILVDPSYAQVGIGVVFGSDGALYVVFDFMQMFPPPQPQPASAAPHPVARTVVMDHGAPRAEAPTTTQPAAPPATVPAPRPSPRRPAVRVAQRQAGPSPSLSGIIGQLRAADAPTRRQRARPATKIVRVARTWTRPSAPPSRSSAPADPSQASRLWLPPSYCEGPNKRQSRMC